MKTLILCTCSLAFLLAGGSKAKAYKGVLEDDPLYELIYAYVILVSANPDDPGAGGHQNGGEIHDDGESHHNTSSSSSSTGLSAQDKQALKTAQNRLINAYVAAFEQGDLELAGAYVAEALFAIFDSNLLDFAALNAAYESGEMLYGDQGSSNPNVWVATWLVYYAYLDALRLQNDVIAGFQWAYKHGLITQEQLEAEIQKFLGF